MVSIEAQKSNPYMSEIDKELKDFFAKYNKWQPSIEKEKLLDIAINETQTKMNAQFDFMDGSADKIAGIKNKLVALNTNLYVLFEEKTDLAKKREKSMYDEGELVGKVGGMIVGAISAVVLCWLRSLL